MEVFNWIDRFRNKQIRRTAEGEQMEIRLRWFRLRWKILDVLDKRGEMEMEMTGRRRKRKSRRSSEDLTVDAWFKHGDGVRLRLMICFRNPQKTQRNQQHLLWLLVQRHFLSPQTLSPQLFQLSSVSNQRVKAGSSPPVRLDPVQSSASNWPIRNI